MKMYVCNESELVDAVAVLAEHGYKDATPDESLCTRKTFRDACGKLWRFAGWDSNRPLVGPPYGIWLEAIRNG